MKWIWPIVFCLACGCNGSSGSPDSGGDAEDGADDGGDSVVSELVLDIPAGTQACTINPVYTGVDNADMPTTFETKGRVTFREGTVHLPTQPGDFQRDWIESLEAGPDGAVAEPSGPGTFSLTMLGESYNYLFSQNYLLQGQPVSLQFGVTFEPGEQVVTIDEDTLTHARFGNFRIETPAGWGYFSTCLYTFFPCTIREFQIEGGDSLKLEHCDYCPPDMICKSDPGVMTRALFTSGGQAYPVEDHFHLAHSMKHHNWGYDFLVRFSPPAGPVGALYLSSDSYPDYSIFSQINYLDDNFTLIETRAVTQQEIKPEW